MIKYQSIIYSGDISESWSLLVVKNSIKQLWATLGFYKNEWLQLYFVSSNTDLINTCLPALKLHFTAQSKAQSHVNYLWDDISCKFPAVKGGLIWFIFIPDVYLCVCAANPLRCRPVKFKSDKKKEGWIVGHVCLGRKALTLWISASRNICFSVWSSCKWAISGPMCHSLLFLTDTKMKFSSTNRVPVIVW